MWPRRKSFRSRAPRPGTARFLPGPPAPRDRPLPLAAAQEVEWVGGHWFDGAPGYEVIVLRLRGPLSAAALRMAFAALHNRHECLRTRFPVVDGRPVQVVEPPRADVLPLTDLSGLAPGDRLAEAVRIAEEAQAAPVVLYERPPTRQALIRMAPEDHVLLMLIPHITADLWSAKILNDDLLAYYTAQSGGLPAQLGPPPAQYADYALWERRLWNQRRVEKELTRWRVRLEGVPALELPADHARPESHRRDCFVAREEIDAELSERLREFARRESTTLFVVLLAAFHCMLGRAAAVERLVTTSLFTGRRGRAVEEMIGPVSDYLAVVGDLSGDPGFREVLRRTQEAWLLAQDFQRLPFSEVVRGIDPGCELLPHPLQQIAFNLHNTPPAVMDFAEDITVTKLETEREDPEYMPGTTDIAFDAYDYATGHIVLDVMLDGRLYEPDSVSVWVERYLLVLRAALADPDVGLSALGTVPAAAGANGPPHGARRPEGPPAVPALGPPPAAGTEQRLALLWGEVVGTPPSTVTEPFFRPGVTEVNAISLLARVAEEFLVFVPLVDFVDSPTILSLRKNIEDNSRPGIERWS